jgi:hypothetical protein
VLAGAGGEQPPVQLGEEAGEAAAIGDDGVAEFFPECPIEVAGHDAEVAADIGDDSADRPAAAISSSVGRRARRGSSVWSARWGSG